MTEEQFVNLKILDQRVRDCEHEVNKAKEITNIIKYKMSGHQHNEIDLFNIPVPVIEKFNDYYLGYVETQKLEAEQRYFKALNDFQYAGEIQYGSEEE